MSPTISIIIPVYNVAPYLDECLESVSCQSWKDFEAILVDDGSTDESRSIAEKWRDCDSRIQVIGITHGGPGKARNAGLDKAKGKYITFIDSDDTVEPDYLKSLLEGLEGGDYDFSMMDVSWDGRKLKDAVLSREKAMEGLLYQRASYASAWGKLFKCDLFADERFREDILYEDLELMVRLMLRVRQVRLIEANMYNYRKRSDSILGQFSEKRLDVLKVTRRIIDIIDWEMPKMIKAAQDRSLSASFNMLILLAKADKKNLPAYDGCWRNVKILRLESLLNPKVRFKNKAGILLSYLGRKLFVRIATKL